MIIIDGMIAIEVEIVVEEIPWIVLVVVVEIEGDIEKNEVWEIDVTIAVTAVTVVAAENLYATVEKGNHIHLVVLIDC